MRRTRALAALLFLLLLPAAAPAQGDGPPTAPPNPGPRPQATALLGEASQAELATLAFLEHLGWRFVADPAAGSVTIEAGQVGHRASLAQAQAAGDLAARVPPNATGAAELRALLPQFVDGSATRLAWLQRVDVAAQTAVTKLHGLVKAGRYKFPQFFFWNSPFFQFHPPPEAWTTVGRSYFASGTSSAALEAFYTRGGLAECYSGQWLVSYAVQYELLGREAFDEVLPGREMVVGRPEDVKPTPLGQTMLSEKTYPYRALFMKPADLKQDAGTFLARLGPKAFAGLTGIVRAQDKSDDANQNFLHVSITPHACQDLREKGGLGWVIELGQRARKAHAASKGPLRGGAAKAQAQAQLAAILAEPVLSEWIIYVHPFGPVQVGWMFHHEMDDADTPVYVMLYLHGREDLFYRRYREVFERRWSRGLPIGPAPAGPGPAGWSNLPGR